MPDFLLEIGTEEIPARMIETAEKELVRRVCDLLEKHYLAKVNPQVFSTPRRLAVSIWTNDCQATARSETRGPSVSVAFKDGKPTKAAEAFAQRVGVPVESLQIMETEKGRYVYSKTEDVGRTAAEILVENLPAELKQLNWPKNMYWRKPTERFVRPVRWIVALLDGEVVPLEFCGIRAGRTSRGHRIIGQENVQIASAGAYVESLRQANVLGAAERE